MQCHLRNRLLHRFDAVLYESQSFVVVNESDCTNSARMMSAEDDTICVVVDQGSHLPTGEHVAIDEWVAGVGLGFGYNGHRPWVAGSRTGM